MGRGAQDAGADQPSPSAVAGAGATAAARRRHVTRGRSCPRAERARTRERNRRPSRQQPGAPRSRPAGRSPQLRSHPEAGRCRQGRLRGTGEPEDSRCLGTPCCERPRFGRADRTVPGDSGRRGGLEWDSHLEHRCQVRTCAARYRAGQSSWRRP